MLVRITTFSIMACHHSFGDCIRMSKARGLQYISSHIGLADLQAITWLNTHDSPPKDVKFLSFIILRDLNECIVSFWSYLNDLYRTLGPSTQYSTVCWITACTVSLYLLEAIFKMKLPPSNISRTFYRIPSQLLDSLNNLMKLYYC